ncbi:MAG TPA: hypothetical protein VMU04_00225 [Candidatus Acidoferrum sp.]|nr:hypothetical protein [Candidatus Acidoferrum sp.]
MLNLLWKLTQPLAEPCLVKGVAALHDCELFCIDHRRYQSPRFIWRLALSPEPLNGLAGEKRCPRILIGVVHKLSGPKRRS